jgi:hypothetical protein
MFTISNKKTMDEHSDYSAPGSLKGKITPSNELSKKPKSQLSNYAAPLGKTGFKTKKYIKKLISQNDNPRYAASKAGSVVGGLLCGMHQGGDNKDELEDI